MKRSLKKTAGFGGGYCRISQRDLIVAAAKAQQAPDHELGQL